MMLAAHTSVKSPPAQRKLSPLITPSKKSSATNSPLAVKRVSTAPRPLIVPNKQAKFMTKSSSSQGLQVKVNSPGLTKPQMMLLQAHGAELSTC